jgi:hypothetical protein
MYKHAFKNDLQLVNGDPGCTLPMLHAQAGPSTATSDVAKDALCRSLVSVLPAGTASFWGSPSIHLPCPLICCYAASNAARHSCGRSNMRLGKTDSNPCLPISRCGRLPGDTHQPIRLTPVDRLVPISRKTALGYLRATRTGAEDGLRHFPANAPNARPKVAHKIA